MATPNSIDSGASDGDNGRSGPADGEGADESGGAWPESKGGKKGGNIGCGMKKMKLRAERGNFSAPTTST
jgi:hypothetical protein